jgi:hypothetical protein
MCWRSKSNKYFFPGRPGARRAFRFFENGTNLEIRPTNILKNNAVLCSNQKNLAIMMLALDFSLKTNADTSGQTYKTIMGMRMLRICLQNELFVECSY